MIKHYTKAEVKIIKDMSLSNEQVAVMINRSKQAIYCKRWTMKLYNKKRKLQFIPTASESDQDKPTEIKRTIDHIIKTKQFKKLVVGNVTIDLENSVITVNI